MLAPVTQAAIATIGAGHYSAEQLDAWAARHPGPERFIERVASGAQIWVAADIEDAPVAYALLEMVLGQGRQSGHLDMLYCHPDHTRRGLAGQLLATAEQAARMIDADRLFTEASELARPAFERVGYTVLHRRDVTIEHDGRMVDIHNYAMEKRLK